MKQIFLLDEKEYESLGKGKRLEVSIGDNVFLFEVDQSVKASKYYCKHHHKDCHNGQGYAAHMKHYHKKGHK